MNRKLESYGKILVPMITPFKQDQSVDYEAAADTARRLLENGRADSLILTGTTGEFFTMTAEERIRLFQAVKEAVGGRIPLIAGTGSASTVEAVALTRKAEELGFEVAMVVSPYYTRPTQEEIYNHFGTVAQAVGIDILLYNIPVFTGVNIEPQSAARLARLGNIVGLKEEAGLNPKQITQFIGATPESFTLYCGDDTMILESYAQGAQERIGGVVSGASHLIGDHLRRMIESFLAGQVRETAAEQQRYFELFAVLGSGGRINPVSLLKEAMNMTGYRAGVPRLPLLPGTEEEKRRVRGVLEKLGLLT